MTIVVKIGGAEGNEVGPVLADLARRSDYVLVHGGSGEIDRLGETMGRPAEYFTSPSGVVSRYTDTEHLEVMVLAMAGRIQTELVRALGALGVRAVGLSGVDGGLLIARKKEASRAIQDGKVVRVKDDLSGVVEEVRADLLRVLLGAGYVPVVGPPAVSRRGELLNVDADRVAAQVAVALHAETLVLLTNVTGVLRDRNDPASRIDTVSRDAVDSMMAYAEGRMRKKVLAAKEAAAGGVGRIVIASSTVPEPIARALAGDGTVIE
ncbi:MAG: [LysW]-aminoadipate kinase [Thermoplasmata archaeon]